MKSIELTLTQILAAVAALGLLLAEKGIPAKTAYWLKRNLDRLSPKDRAYRESVQKRFEEQAQVAPDFKFIPPDRYKNFKDGLSKVLDHLNSDEVKKYVESFETEIQKGAKFLPSTKMNEFNQEVSKDADEMKEEVEFATIIVGEQMEKVFEKVAGNVLGELWWMVEFPEAKAEPVPIKEEKK